VFHQGDNLVIESALGRTLGRWSGCPAGLRRLAVNALRADYSWAWPGREYLGICGCIGRK
jgi:starch synthase